MHAHIETATLAFYANILLAELYTHIHTHTLAHTYSHTHIHTHTEHQMHTSGTVWCHRLVKKHTRYFRHSTDLITNTFTIHANVHKGIIIHSVL